jgi:sugar phosphate isomerase/epimerase
MTDLLATCWTHAGDAFPVPGHDLSPLPLRERAEAVARAGYVGIGFTIEDLLMARQDQSYAEIRTMLDDLGLHFTEVEFLLDWWTVGPRREHSDLRRGQLFEAAEALGARHVKIGPDIDIPGTGVVADLEMDHWAAELHTLAQQAADHGTRVALEVLPMSNLADFTQAAELIAAADHPAAGLCLDVWHVDRGPSTLVDIAKLPPELVFAVELDDGDAEVVGTLYEDTAHQRRLCGEGVFDVKGFVRTLQGLGFQGPWGVEIISQEHRRRSLQEAVERARDSALAQFD